MNRVQTKALYHDFLRMFLFVAMQNVIAYSVNMADNLMLGTYSQAALSGAATVNQIQFLVQQLTISIGGGLIALVAQYWGAHRVEPIRYLTGVALWCGVFLGGLTAVVAAIWPRQILGIFTDDPQILAEGMAYLRILRFSYLLFSLTQILMAALRAVGTVNISFYVSLVSLIVNVGINYTLIFGNFGAPEMGIRGAAIGTLIARALELLLVAGYALLKDKKLQLLRSPFWRSDRNLWKAYLKVSGPMLLSSVLWAVSVPMQTAVLGHLSADAIAANSVSTTVYQYLKVITVSEATVFSVLLGQAVGAGGRERAIAYAKRMQVMAIIIGVVLGLALLAIRRPLLSFYELNDHAMELASQIILVMAVVMVGMAYQMPVCMGIMHGGGDTKFTMYMNLVSVWGIVMPLTFLSAFVWHWPVPAVVAVIQSDQVFKCLPAAIRLNRFRWIHQLTEGQPKQKTAD